MKQQQELCKKLSTSSDMDEIKHVKPSKKGKIHGNVKQQKILTNDVMELNDDFSKGLPSIAELHGLLNVVDKREKRRKSSQHSGRKHKKSKKKCSLTTLSLDTGSSDSESDSSSTESEESSGEESTPDKRCKKGKNQKSGLYVNSGNAKVISGELFAHAALDDELGG